MASTVGYTGLLGGPPAVGFLAEHSGLPAAPATVLPALIAAALSVADSPEPARIGMLRVGAAMRRHGAGLTELVSVAAPA